MKTQNTKRRIVETAVGAALGAAIAGPAGAVAGGLIGNKAAAKIENLSARKRGGKRSKPGAKAVHTDLKRILVPVDFSTHSLHAVRFARDWAKRFHAEVRLLHVAEPLNTAAPFGAQPVILPPRPPGFRSAIRIELDKLARKEFPGSAKVSVEVREGIPHHAIVAAARKLKADIIIIATLGRTGLMRALIGSTAERVVRHAPCPVLTVRST